MWSKVKTFLSEEQTQAEDLQDHDNQQIALAALLVHAAFADDDYQAEEHDNLKKILQNRFDLDADDVDKLIDSAHHEFTDAVDLYSFVRVVNQNFDNDGRQEVVKLLWQVILADGHIDNFEDNLIRKVCHLLGVSPRDRVRMKQEAQKS